MARTKMDMRPGASDASVTLGNHIRQARTERGWTIAALGERINVSSPTVRAMESGSGSVAIGTYLNAADMLGVPLFAETVNERRRVRRASDAMIALIPRRVDTPRKDAVDDYDF